MLPNYTPLRLKKRAEFLAIRRQNTTHRPSFIIKWKDRGECSIIGVGNAPRLGLTVSKKNGGAVVRNKIKRRLREAIRLSSGQHLKANCDYVIIAKPAIIKNNFQDLIHELNYALSKTK